MPQIHTAGVPTEGATELTPIQRAYTQLVRDADLLVYGHHDFDESDEAQLEAWKATRYWDVRRLVVLDDDDAATAPAAESRADAGAAAAGSPDGSPGAAPARALGVAMISLPLEEDKELAHLWLWVRPEARGRGLGRALADAAERIIREAGRTSVQVWRTGAIVPHDAPEALVPPTGFGAVDRTAPEIQWMISRGFVLEQVERVSTLVIPTEVRERTNWLNVVGGLREDAHAQADGYRLVTWEGPTPEELREPYAQLKRRMSVDIPHAGLSNGEAEMTSERIAYNDERAKAKGAHWIVVAVERESDGMLVAYTELEWPRADSPGVWQMDTFVHGEHRGHRIGMWIKTEMLFRLLAANPAAERIHTWNADENQYMLSINEVLGFEPVAYESAWELRGL